MNYSFQKTYTLLPQSPLIHFQHDQSGATLRATEVKPKLDRYIIRRWRREHGGADIPGSWKIPNTPEGKTALKYQLRITAAEPIKQVRLDYYEEKLSDGTTVKHREYDIYYGNMGSGAKKQGIIAECNLTVTCVLTELLNYMDDVLFDFFIVTNFGTMQNKGFGSFRVKVEGKPIRISDMCEILKREYGVEHIYYFKADKEFRERSSRKNKYTGRRENTEIVKGVFNQIKIVYSLIKSGVNLSSMPQYRRLPAGDDRIPYRRSMLFTYMHDNGIGNEKAWMKQNRISPVIGEHKYRPNAPDSVARYVRALLGVGEAIEYKNSSDNPRDKVTVKIAETGKEIERLSSPIMFKIIGAGEHPFVLFFGRKIDEAIYGKTFEFSSALGSDKLTVPSKEELPVNFMDSFMHYVYLELKKCQKKFAEIAIRYELGDDKKQHPVGCVFKEV